MTVCRPCVRAHVTTRLMYGHAPGIYGETETSLGTDQYSTGMLNPLPDARFREHLLVYLKVEWWTHRTRASPAATITIKSSSVVQISQCGLIVLHLADSEFVNHRVVIRHNENARRYPQLASAHSSERLFKEDQVRSTLYLENKPPYTG